MSCASNGLSVTCDRNHVSDRCQRQLIISERRLIHIDLDAFYAQVVERARPELREPCGLERLRGVM